MLFVHDVPLVRTIGVVLQAAALAKEANDALAKAQNDSMVKELGVGELLQKVVVAANGANLDVKIEWTKMQVETVQKAVSPFLR